MEAYLINSLEKAFQKTAFTYSVSDAKADRKPRRRSPESYRNEQARLNLLFQKERISWEHYEMEYAKIQEKIDALSSPKNVQNKNLGSIKKLLSSGSVPESDTTANAFICRQL